jgi:AmmeMemoRadiSam system protein A
MNSVRPEQGTTLLALARDAIARRLGIPGVAHERPGWLQEPGATFVTLTREGRLRGCIGSLQPWRSLQDDVCANAIAAALQDPRFPPVPDVELASVRIEVSLLSAMSALEFASETEARTLLRPGVDGVVLEYGRARGTFLPQVWEALPQPRDFLDQLKRKAGLAPDFWHEELRLSCYTVTKWRETEPVHGTG